jgi:hypothetical protein
MAIPLFTHKSCLCHVNAPKGRAFSGIYTKIKAAYGLILALLSLEEKRARILKEIPSSL